jgi:hypothetical protein
VWFGHLAPGGRSEVRARCGALQRELDQ